MEDANGPPMLEVWHGMSAVCFFEILFVERVCSELEQQGVDMIGGNVFKMTDISSAQYLQIWNAVFSYLDQYASDRKIWLACALVPTTVESWEEAKMFSGDANSACGSVGTTDLKCPFKYSQQWRSFW